METRKFSAHNSLFSNNKGGKSWQKEKKEKAKKKKI